MMAGHWILPAGVEPDDVPKYEGFVYKITRKTTGKMYIGKKYIIHRRSKKQPSGRKKWTSFESDWREYTGSSKILNGDITLYGKSDFTFEILSLHKTRGMTDYTEQKEQMMRDVLSARDSNNNFLYYNENIACKFYRK